MRRIACLILLCVAAAFPAYRYMKQKDDAKQPIQPPLEPVTEWQIKKASELVASGMALYHDKNFAKAESLFTLVLNRMGRTPAAEAAAVMAAQCYIRAEKYEKARWILTLFPKQYGQSPYVNRVHYLYGLLLAYDGDVFAAAKRFLYVYKYDLNPELAAAAKNGALLLFEYRLTPEQILDLADRLDKTDEMTGWAWFYAARLLLGQKRFEESSVLFSRFIDSFPQHPELATARSLLSSAESGKEAVIKIGVLLPQTADFSYYNDIGQSVLKGIELAAAEYNKNAAVKVKLIVRDTKADPVLTYKITEDLITREKVAAFIGPLSSEELCVTAALTEPAGIPVIAPTASATGIDSLGSHVFLLATTKAAQAKFLARYAFDSLRINEYIIIFPNDNYGNTMASAFRDVIEERGGSLFAYEMYQKGEKNYKDILDRIHAKKVEEVFAKRALERGEILGRSDRQYVEVDSLFMADSAVEIGAIFMPGYPDEIVMLAPQVPFYKIHTQMLGSRGWYDANVLKHAGRYMENAIIVVDFVDNSDSPQWKGFQSLFSKAYRATPDPNNALGFDAANLLFDRIRGADAAKLLKRLQKTEEYAGAYATFRFTPDFHANTSTVFLRIKDEEFVKVPVK